MNAQVSRPLSRRLWKWFALLVLLAGLLAAAGYNLPPIRDRVRGRLQKMGFLPLPLPQQVLPIAPDDRVSARRMLLDELSTAVQAKDYARAARINAILSQEAFQRAYRATLAWEGLQDPATHLIPYAPYKYYSYWNGKDTAADLYPHLLIASLYLDPDGQADWLSAITSEWNLCGDLACQIDLERDTIVPEDQDTLIFGTAEYAKDGLLAIMERFGEGPWLDRMSAGIDAVLASASVETPYGNLPSAGSEVNGDLLQVLCRLYWASGDEKYLAMAERIANAYFFIVLPANNGLPADYWDFENNQPTTEDQRFRPAAEIESQQNLFRIVDHGGEIIPGLAELYFLETQLGRPQADDYREPMHALLDKLLTVSRMPDGLWYQSIDVETLEPYDEHPADTWGYLVNAYQTVDLAEGSAEYAPEIIRAMTAASQLRSNEWEGQIGDGYADAIESMLYLLPWFDVPAAHAWVDDQIEVLFLKQTSDGFVERWYLDGNFVRTALLYGQYKTAGVMPQPWTETIRLGAYQEPDRRALHLFLTAEEDWQGKLVFDSARHEQIWNMPVNYPRLNSLPEWYPVVSGDLYLLTDEMSGETRQVTGSELLAGIPAELEKGHSLALILRRLD